MTGDTLEEIRRCLECKHPRCINCLAGQKGHPMGRPGKPLIGKRHDGSIRFPSLAAAAAALNVDSSSISAAIRRGGRCRGYYWKYEGV